MFRFSFLLLAVLILFSGCVYYNTFFNAEKYFDEAQAMALKDSGQPSATAIQDYNKTIKKCGIVLTDYKDSKYADDALFLMARCFYYIGRNYTQALKHFNELIEFYPESEFVPDAKLYIARSNYKFTKKELAFELLQEFLQNNKYKDHHAKALQLLADYHLADKNFVDADYYLNRIIEKYPKSEEYASAFFLQGKTQYEAGNYEQSNEVFFSLLKSKVPRNLKFDARYYIALNYIMLNDFKKAEKYSLKLLKDEYREDMISKIHVLKARSLVGNAKYDEAIQLFETVMIDNPRSMLSAEASFYLGELYFNEMHDYEKAIENYNKVKTEYSQSKYLEQAVTRSAVASQIIQFNNPNSELTVEELVLQQFKLAEFYVEFLNMPDSALIVYDHITQQKDRFFLQLDSLRINLKAYTDSLETFTRLEESMNIEKSNADTTGIVEMVNPDSTDNVEIVIADTLDAMEIVQYDPEVAEEKNQPDPWKSWEETQYDSEILTETSVDSTFAMGLADSTKTLTLNEVKTEKLRFQSAVNTFNQQIVRNEADIVKYENEFIPFAKFIKLWLYKVIYQDSLRMQEQFADLALNFPENKYTYAAELMLQNKKVEVTTRQQIMELAQYEKSIENIYTAPDSAKILLQEIIADTTHSFYLKANYSLGYLNHFLLADSVSAKQYYDVVLTHTEDNEYRPAVQKLYDGSTFKVVTRLPSVIQLERKRAAAEQAALEELEKESSEAEEKADKQAADELEKSSKQKESNDEERRKAEIEEKQKQKNIEIEKTMEEQIPEEKLIEEPDKQKDELLEEPAAKKEEVIEEPAAKKEEVIEEPAAKKEEVIEEPAAKKEEVIEEPDKNKEEAIEEPVIKEEEKVLPKETMIIEEEASSDSTKATKQAGKKKDTEETEEEEAEETQQPGNSTEN